MLHLTLIQKSSSSLEMMALADVCAKPKDGVPTTPQGVAAAMAVACNSGLGEPLALPLVT